MAVIRINASRDGALVLAGGGDWIAALHDRLATLAPGAPVCILVHGYRFTPHGARPCRDPHQRLYRTDPVAPSTARRPPLADWPHALGFSEGDAADGLCIAFGWDGRRQRLRTLLTRGRSDFALVFEGAATAGLALARLGAGVAAARPDLGISLLAHSLGARVALAAMRARPDLPWTRAILLGAAEYAGTARALLAVQDRLGQRTEIVHALSRANDLYDGLFQVLAPRPGRAGDRPLGAAGLGIAHPRWLDLQLDHPDLGAWAARRGMAPLRPREVLSHWHFYGDPAAMALWRRMLRASRGWDLASLRAAGIPQGLEPRWSTLTPRPRLPLPWPRPAAPRPAALTQG